MILLLVGTFLTGTFWSVSTPVGSSPDEVFHLGSIYCAHGNSPMCQLPEHAQGWRQTAKIPAFIATTCYREGPVQSRPYHSAACQAALANDKTLMPTTINHAGGYPEGFYDVMSVFAGSNIVLSVILMRLVNVLIFTVLLAFGLFLLSRRLSQSLVLTVAVGFVPVGFFFVFSVNPTAWALMGVLFYWMFLSELVRTTPPRTPRILLTVLTGLTAALAITSRSDSAIFIAFVSVVVGIQWLSRSQLRRRFELLVPVAVSIWGLIVGATSSQLVNETHDRGGSGISLFVRNLVEMPLWIFGNFGMPGTPKWPMGLSWYDVPLPIIVPALVLLCLGGLAFVLRGSWGRRKLIAFLVSLGMVLAFPLAAMQRAGMNGSGWMHPRYILPVLIVTLAILFTSRSDDEPSILQGRARSWFTIAALTVAMSATQYTLIRRFVTGIDGRLISLSHDAQWWWTGFWLSPDAVWVLGSLVAGVMFYGLIMSARRDRAEVGV